MTAAIALEHIRKALAERNPTRRHEHAQAALPAMPGNVYGQAARNAVAKGDLEAAELLLEVMAERTDRQA